VVPVADPGRNVTQADLVHGATVLAVIDLPALNNVADSAPNVVVAANGTSVGWRSAPLLASVDGGVSYVAIGATAAPAVMGAAETVLAVGTNALVDRVNTVDVMLVHAGLVLNDADDAALLAGANFAMLGREAIQFGRALPMGGARYRLSELWRGRRGTEAAVTGHVVGEGFVLLESEALMQVPAAFAVAGLKIMAAGIGDGAGVSAFLPTAGASVTPLSPVAPTLEVSGGGLTVRWTRRSREGWSWLDGIDVPLGQEGERYRVTRIATGRADVAEEVALPVWTYPSALFAADRGAGLSNVTLQIVQIGSRGVSVPTTLTIPLI
jgi:hypothetical protein